MRKIFSILFLLFISIWATFASNDLKIITREEWWANENYRYIESTEWQNIFKKWEEDAIKQKNTVYTEKQKEIYRLKQEKLREMDEILLRDFGWELEIESKRFYEVWKKLAWPIVKTKKVKWIVIHHTYSEYSDSKEGVNQIYKYHAITRQWWDIWYNYLIWKDGEIYEWRAGWDYVVAAHDKWNNMATIWIAIIWNHSEEPINIKQYNALLALTRNLVEKYDIDLTEKTYFHQECIWNNCELPLKSELKTPIIGHRDAWHTSCPWDALYAQIQNLKKTLLKDPSSVANAYKKKIYKTLSKFSDEKLISILANIEADLDIKRDSNKLKLKWLLISYFEYNNSKNIARDDNDSEIKIKLSYPNKDNITVKSGGVDIEIKRRWDNIYVKWHKFNILTIPKKDPNSILEITSWDRVPSWDKVWKYNDNKFRGDIIVYVKNDELVVVNKLKIEDYLKWLWEVSNFEDPEKIKTIIIAARSYATWYITKARKFPWEFYDWIDDPNIFQKYLWYWLETRSPVVNSIVNETKGKLITYEWELIKPWYFSSSNWSTMSFYEYCSIRYSDEICSKEAKKYPYLQSVVDKWWEWKTKAGHGVWISWTWISYFAEKWWSYDMIIKYFLKWVEVL